MPDYEHVEYEVTEGRAEIRFDRPDRMNAFTAKMVTEINDAITSAMDDKSVYVLLLTGNGRGFCAGADLDHLGSEDTQLEYSHRLRDVQNIVYQLYHGPKPSVAAVNGPAIGAGSDWGLACDIRLLGKSGFFREQFVNIGLVPGDGGGWLLARLIGESRAKQYLLTGRDIGPEEALDSGLAMDIVPDEDLLAEARSLANELRDKPARAIRGTKACVDATMSFEDYSRQVLKAQWECLQDPEQAEAVTALQESRAPDYDRPY